ncbi:hypothetical protein ACFPA8_12355 [Streptomyces ovatisporus]|uniref:Uncharacterized protein n=1 Tax=Streptomyces ovatisporus TaxID=1128682 RepID=A0ABV9A635_9ACTN
MTDVPQKILAARWLEATAKGLRGERRTKFVYRELAAAQRAQQERK